MAIGPDDFYGALNADPEPEWPGELPEIDELWQAFWQENTISEKAHRYYTGYGGRYPLKFREDVFKEAA